MLDAVDWAYAAGFLDGEGHIQLVASSPSNREVRIPQLRVRLSNTNFEIIDWLAENFGSARTYVTTLTNPRAKPQKTVHWSGEKALVLLAGMLPYLKVKRPQAEIVLDLGKQKAVVGRKPYQSWPKEVVEVGNKAYAELKRLNKRGIA